MDWKITRTFLRSEMISYRDSSRESTTYFSLNLMFKREVISLMQSAECGFKYSLIKSPLSVKCHYSGVKS